jgi:mannose-1-phosphate guanylyltransferase
VLLATAIVSTSDPGAVMVVTPSDHGVRDGAEFRDGVMKAATHVRRHADEVVLLGVEPQSAAGDYGWIVTTDAHLDGTCEVASFVEKPSLALAEQLFASGAVWNTMVLVARAEGLLALYRRQAPDLAAAFEGLRFLSLTRRQHHLRQMYRHLPMVDFSHDVLTRAVGLQCLAWRSSIGWTDLGTPERLAAWLARSREWRPNDAAQTESSATVPVH